MSSTAPTAETLPDVTRAVQTLLPDMRRKSLEGWLYIALVVVVAVAVSAGLAANIAGTDGWQWSVIVLALGIGLIALIVGQIRKAHESAVMPILATTVGLTYQKDARAFVNALPRRLLPEGGLRSGEDLLSGLLGGRMIRLAEVRIETGGKNSRTLFKGVVANFPNAADMPSFFIAEEGKTGRTFWFANRLDVEGLVQIRTVTGGMGRRYSVWASSAAVSDHPALAAVLEILTDLERRVGENAQLFSATSNGEEMHVALIHARDLYRIGGMFIDQARLLADVQAAYRDLQVPLTIATRLMEAEMQLGIDSAGQQGETNAPTR